MVGKDEEPIPAETYSIIKGQIYGGLLTSTQIAKIIDASKKAPSENAIDINNIGARLIERDDNTRGLMSPKMIFDPSIRHSGMLTGDNRERSEFRLG